MPTPPSSPINDPAVSPLASANSSRGLGCAISLSLLFAAVGVFGFWMLTIAPLRERSASRSWVETPCEILSSELAVHHDFEGDTYRVAIRYRYVWQGVAHENDRYDFSRGSTNVGVSGMRAAVTAHPPGRQTVCYVDPADPSSAVLSRDAPGAAFGAFTLLFPLFGLGFVVALTRGRAARPAPVSIDPTPPGEVTLEPAIGRVSAFVVTLCGALFWNAVVSGFAVEAVREAGRGRWLMAIVQIPFVAIGLSLLAAALRSFSRLIAPAVEVRLDPSHLRLEARVPVTWRLRGRGMRRLSLRLVAREEATCDDDSTPEKVNFHRSVLFESADRRTLAEGVVELVLPDVAVTPSFKAANNKIIWELVVDGETLWSADVCERFVLHVRGAASPAPPAAEPTSLPHHGAGLALTSAERFAPGDMLVFTLARDAGSPAAADGALTVRLGWFTDGKGLRDAAIVWSEELHGLGPGDERAFEVRLPDAPWSFKGKLITTKWHLEVVDAQGAPLVSVPLVLAPGGKAATLLPLPRESSAFERRTARKRAERADRR